MSKPRRGRPPGSAVSLTSKTKSSKKNSLPSLLPTFINTELTKENCTCSLCVSILIEPVSLPCFHRLCLKCFNAHVKESLYCPFCRKRLSIWSRQISNSKDSNYVDLDLWDRIKTKFPTIVKARLEELENENENDMTVSNSIEIQNQVLMEEEELWNKVNGGEPSGENQLKRDAILTTEKGEILEDYNNILKDHIGDIEVINRRQLDEDRAYILQLEEEERIKDEEDKKKLDEQMIADFELAKKLQEEEESLNNQINNVNVNIKPKNSPPTTRGKQKRAAGLQIIKPPSSSSIKKKSLVPQKRKMNNKPSASSTSTSSGSGGSQSSILDYIKSKRDLSDDFFGESVNFSLPTTTTTSSFVPFISTPENFGSIRKTSTETITNSNSSHFDDENVNTDDDEYGDFVVKEEYDDDSFMEMSPLKRRRIPKDGTPDSLSSEVNSHFRPIKTAPRTPSTLSTADSQNNCLAKPTPTYLPGDVEPMKKSIDTFISHPDSSSYLNN